MFREGFLEEPAVAQILDQQLTIWTATGRTFQFPIDRVSVEKIRRNNWLGRYPWWGKTILHLNAADKTKMVFGLKDGDAWEQKLRGNA